MGYRVQEGESKNGPWSDAVVNASKKGWDNCTFDNQKDAEEYAYSWCNYATKDESEKLAVRMKLGIPHMYVSNVNGSGVYMRIVEG